MKKHPSFHHKLTAIMMYGFVVAKFFTTQFSAILVKTVRDPFLNPLNIQAEDPFIVSIYQSVSLKESTRANARHKKETF